MTNKRTTKQQLVASVVLLFMCFSMLLGTTFAWFTDSATSAGNKIVAGKLDVQLWMYDESVSGYVDISDSNAPVIGDGDALFGVGDTANENSTATLWEPGKTQVVYLKIVNAGSLDLKYQVAINVRDTDGEQNLYEVLKYDIVENAKDGAGVDKWEGGKSVKVGNNIDTTDVKLPAKKDGSTDHEHYFALAVHMDEDAGNKYQGGSVEFDIKVLATQVASEEDSFNNQYDKDATYVSAETVEELQAAIANGEPVSLTEDITMDAGNFTVAADTKAVIDLGGNNLTVTNADTSAAFLKVEGDLTITGEGNVATRQINTYEGSKLTLGEGVTIETSNSFAINNSGTTVIDGATINHTGTNHAIQNQGGTLIIDDATVTSTSTSNISTINSTGGTVIINGGTFVHEGSMGSVIKWLYSNEGEIIINGGTFIQKGGESLASIDYGDAKLTINGGTFDSASYFAQPAQNIVINAGEFKNNAIVVFNPVKSWTIADKYIPATSTATTNADGSITVTVND